MKSERLLFTSFALALFPLLNSQLSTAFAQGSLTPRGAHCSRRCKFSLIL